MTKYQRLMIRFLILEEKIKKLLEPLTKKVENLKKVMEERMRRQSERRLKSTARTASSHKELTEQEEEEKFRECLTELEDLVKRIRMAHTLTDDRSNYRKARFSMIFGKASLLALIYGAFFKAFFFSHFLGPVGILLGTFLSYKYFFRKRKKTKEKDLDYKIDAARILEDLGEHEAARKLLEKDLRKAGKVIESFDFDKRSGLFGKIGEVLRINRDTDRTY